MLRRLCHVGILLLSLAMLPGLAYGRLTETDQAWAGKMTEAWTALALPTKDPFFVLKNEEAVLAAGKGAASKSKDEVRLKKEGTSAKWTFTVKEAGTWHLFLMGAGENVKKSSFLIDGKSHGFPGSVSNLSLTRVDSGKGLELGAGEHTFEVILEQLSKPNGARGISIALFSKDDKFNTHLSNAGLSQLNEMLIRSFVEELWRDYPQQCDWFLQDNQVNDGWGKRNGIDARGDFGHYLTVGRDNSLEKKLLASVAKETGGAVTADYPAGDKRWLEEYLDLCGKRRTARLKLLLAKTNKIIYAKHHNMGSIYLATETQGCPPGSELRIIDLSPAANGEPVKDEALFDSQNGIVRDPEVSFDGKKMLFAWRKTNGNAGTVGAMAPTTGNYKIYEMDLATHQLRQLTTDETYGADFEPCYLPNGDIMFSSARCVQEVTCGWGDCSNLYIMNKDGKYARRIGFDQTQTAFPHLLEDGRVVYTRRDYNDRGQTYAHALFVMNHDGTKQTEYYKNNTCEPTSLQHTRPIPGTDRTMSIAGGYHTNQGGKLVVIDINKGRQEYQGLSFINWDPAKKITAGDNYGREGEQYIYPYPLDANCFLVGFDPIGGYMFSKDGKVVSQKEHYRLYFMTPDGRRELLASHNTLSCGQSVPVMQRVKPITRANGVDYTKNTGTFYVQNVYLGQSSKGIAKGSIKKLRISKLFYKPVTLGGACWGPPSNEIGPGKKYSSFGQHSVTPVGVGSASFDAKEILGEVDVHEDGSCMFEAPARTPVFFQMIDQNGNVAQSMRSWAVLMPNENFSCIGCHEEKGVAPPPNTQRTIAMQGKPQKLQPFAGVSGRPFSYAKMVQPIWDRHCVSCHAPGKKAAKIDLSATIVQDIPNDRTSAATRRKFYQSYLTLLKVERRGKSDRRLSPGTPNEWVSYWTRLLTVELTAPYYAGSAKSKLITLLKTGHGKTKLTADEINTVSAWIDLNVPFIGEYDEMNDWNAADISLFGKKMAERRRNEAIDTKNIADYIKDGQP